MNIVPLNERILVKVADKKANTAQLGEVTIELAGSREVPQDRAEVVAVSEGSPVEVGQTVIFQPHGGSMVEHEGVEYLMLRNADLIAVLA